MSAGARIRAGTYDLLVGGGVAVVVGVAATGWIWWRPWTVGVRVVCIAGLWLGVFAVVVVLNRSQSVGRSSRAADHATAVDGLIRARVAANTYNSLGEIRNTRDEVHVAAVPGVQRIKHPTPGFGE